MHRQTVRRRLGALVEAVVADDCGDAQAVAGEDAAAAGLLRLRGALRVLRQALTAASSRQNDSDRILPGSVRLWKRSTEMKPSMPSSSGLQIGGDVEIGLALPSAGGPRR